MWKDSEGLSASGQNRPGAMTMAMRAVRRSEGDRSALRVAIARAGRIEREWTIESGAVTFGRSHEADVFVAEHASRATTLVTIDEGAMTLSVPHGATGRVQHASGARDLAVLAGTSITLDASARGRVVLAGRGEDAVALLFQRVAKTEQRMRPELPASVRGGILSRVDGLFTMLVAASFMLHMGFVALMSQADWPIPPSLALVDERVADIVFSDAALPPIPELADAHDPTTPDAPSMPTAPDSPTTPSHTPRTPHPTSTPSSASADPSIDVTQQINVAVQTLIGATGVDGALRDLLNNGQPTQNSAQILAAAAAVDPTASMPAMRNGHTSGIPDGTFGPRHSTVATHALDEGEPVVEHAPRPPHIAIDPSTDPIDPSTGFDDAVLRRALRARMPQIQMCYEHQLTRQPGLAGRISLSMQVERIGILSHVEAIDDTVGSRELSECVINNVRTIRVPNGPSEPVTVQYPIVFEPQS